MVHVVHSKKNSQRSQFSKTAKTNMQDNTCIFQQVEITDIFALPNEHVYEVDEGELDEGREHGDETDDDEDVQRGGITNLRSTYSMSRLKDD